MEVIVGDMEGGVTVGWGATGGTATPITRPTMHTTLMIVRPDMIVIASTTAVDRARFLDYSVIVDREVKLSEHKWSSA